MFFSRSNVRCYQTCALKRFINYHACGTGIVQKRLKMGMSTGSFVHDGLATIMQYAKEHDTTISDGRLAAELGVLRVDCEQQWSSRGLEVSAGSTYEIKRQLALGEALIRGWVRVRLPVLLRDHRVAAVEDEHLIPIGEDMKMGVKLDAVLRRRSDDALIALEFKTTGTMQKDYIESWRYSSQTVVETAAIEHIFGEPCVAVRMEFLWKGIRRKDERNVTGYSYYSPMVRGYRKTVVDNPITPAESQVEYGFDSSLARKKGWEAFDPWSCFSVEEWLDTLPSEVLEAQYASHEVYRNYDEVQRWLKQTAICEQQIGEALCCLDEDAMIRTFPGNFDESCYSDRFGHKCDYLDMCFGGLTPEDALKSGEFVAREPHYGLEKGE